MLSSSAGARLPVSPPSQIPSVIEPAEEMLYGAKAIAKFLYGDERYDRRVYHLAENKRVPIMRIPGLSARKSTLLRWLVQQEQASTASPVKDDT